MVVTKRTTTAVRRGANWQEDDQLMVVNGDEGEARGASPNGINMFFLRDNSRISAYSLKGG